MPPFASPAANVTSCSSQMPTSKKRSGNSRANGARPVPSRIAAVSAQTFGSRRAAAHTAAPNASDHPVVLRGLTFFTSLNAARSNGPTPCQAVGSVSAGRNPFPFTVVTRTATGRDAALASSNAAASAARSCPSTGPRRAKPHASRSPSIGQSVVADALSFTTRISRFVNAVQLPKASNAMPFAKAASPTTATTCSPPPR